MVRRIRKIKMVKKHSHPAKWVGSRYRRKETNTWRSNVTGNIYSKPSGGKYLGNEPTRAHSYSGKGLSKRRVAEAKKLFRRK